jgi:CTP synthase
MIRYIFVAGGVMSGIGKGVATASIGKILQSKGFKVTAIKIDPYINLDAGTMNPIEHGEVFVMADGTECDQDVGHYERFLDINLSTDNYITTGRVYQAVINRERNLEYRGKCVEVVPHIPEEVIIRIKKVAQKDKADFVLIEIGGTVSEYQNILFLEAARIMKFQQPKAVLFILVSYVPILKNENVGEMKTKPTQNAVRTLNGVGIQPDIILARSQFSLDEPRKKKISIFCNIAKEDIISAPDVNNIYEIPINFEKNKIGERIFKKFNLKTKKQDLKDWQNLLKTIQNVKKSIKIGIVGKYFETGKFILIDSYISVIEAIKHSAWFYKRKPEIYWLSAENYDPSTSLEAKKNLENLNNLDGIIIPGGFGGRGIEGKIKVIKFCRENKIPFLGLCLGMQLAIIEFARNVCNLKEANSTEFILDCKYPVIDVILEQKTILKNKKYGGTMRLGAYSCKIKPKTKTFLAYKSNFIFERHRHRYEFNNNFREKLMKHGLIISGINPEKDLVEIIEIKNHPFFIGTQFHPEFKSKLLKPHPLFREFIRSALKHSQS